MSLETSGLVGEVFRLVELIDRGVEKMRTETEKAAEAERDYRHLRSTAWLRVPDGYGTAAAKAAWVDGETAQARYVRDLAEGTRTAAWEALRSRRAQLSACQTLVATARSEAELAKFGPELAP